MLLSYHLVTVDYPFHQVPCAYMRLCNQSGELIRASALERILGSHYAVSSAMPPSPQFRATLEQPAWIEEEHPISGLPGLSLHVCGIVDRMKLLTGDIPAADPLYLLKWLTMMGPFIGMEIEPGEYVRLSDEVSKRARQKGASVLSVIQDSSRPIIVGGGIHGLCIAYFLIKRGLRPIGEKPSACIFMLELACSYNILKYQLLKKCKLPQQPLVSREDSSRDTGAPVRLCLCTSCPMICMHNWQLTWDY